MEWDEIEGLEGEYTSSLESFSGDGQLRIDRSRWTVFIFICGPTLVISTRNERNTVSSIRVSRNLKSYWWLGARGCIVCWVYRTQSEASSVSQHTDTANASDDKFASCFSIHPLGKRGSCTLLKKNAHEVQDEVCVYTLIFDSEKSSQRRYGSSDWII